MLSVKSILNKRVSDVLNGINDNIILVLGLIDDDKLITVFESNAKIYKRHKKGTDIITLDINKILTKT